MSKSNSKGGKPGDRKAIPIAQRLVKGMKTGVILDLLTRSPRFSFDKATVGT